MTAAENRSPLPVAAPDFQAQFEPLLKMAARQGREIIVTQHGYPVARVTPYAPRPGDPPFPAMEKPAAAANSAPDPAEEPPVLEGFVNGNRYTLQVFGDIDRPMPAEWFGEVSPDGTPNPVADPAAANPAPDPPEEPPILEDVIEIKDADGNVIDRKVFHLQIWGDIMAPIDEEWEAEANPDRVLNPYLPRTAATADPDPDQEPLILEDVFEIKDADGNVVERKVFHFQIRGEAVPPINAAWKDEVNPDRTLNPDLPSTAGGEIPIPKPGEPPILEDVIEIKDADGNVVERKVYGLQIWGDIVAPIDEAWEAEVNPDRTLNPC